MVQKASTETANSRPNSSGALLGGGGVKKVFAYSI